MYRIQKKKELDRDYYEKKYDSPYPVDNLMPVYYSVLGHLNSINGKNLNILDIGCGMGNLASLLKKYGYSHYKGFDISSTGIAKAKADIPEWKENFFIHSCYELKKRQYDYDASIACEVLEHVDDFKLIDQIKKGSYFIGSVPNYWASGNEHMRIYKNNLSIKLRFSHA
ncbi:MAG: class I SAM-dependent methyltransferase [Fibrobacterota bacterium]